MFNMYQKKVRGRPKLHKQDPNIANMRITAELKSLIESEMKVRETMAECCLRLIRDKEDILKKVTALERALEESDIEYAKAMEKRFGPETISV